MSPRSAGERCTLLDVNGAGRRLPSLAMLWRNHHLHHYKHSDMGFGVSSTMWDHVFGTMFDLKKEKEDKEKVKELMFTKKTA